MTVYEFMTDDNRRWALNTSVGWTGLSLKPSITWL